ncbi:MAG: shikimate dehydrogenase [Candidatus Omnitrophica bacterium]|nr:shikimate dehydrogenase [Candidatus Omnitrophota bacterium]
MKTYGLLGKNISYSLSPFMHNAAFKARNLKAEYRIFNLPENALGSFFEDMRKGTISGCNVTIPHKESALKFIDKCDDLVRNIKAVNTITSKDDKLFGYNTDCQGFIETLIGKNPGDLNFKSDGKDVFVFGAGGAAKAVIYGLINSGAKRIIIADIDEARAERLAQAVTEKENVSSVIAVVKDKAKYEEFISKADLLVNATPCGMKESDPPLFDYRYIHEKLYIFDLIYTSLTPLTKEATSRGAKAVNGLNMLLYQAGAAFKIWTGVKAPLEVMRGALLENIKK